MIGWVSPGGPRYRAPYGANKSTTLIHVVESLKSRAEFCLKLNHWNKFVKARHPSENCNAIMKTLFSALL